MSGFVNIVLEDKESQLSEDAKHCMGRVAAASKKMGQLIDALLNLSHISRRQIVPVPVNLSAIAHEVSKELRSSQPDRRVEFEIDDGMQVTGDPQLLKAAVANLLTNAWKYTGKLKTPSRIQFCRESVDGQTCFIVRDNGVGFDMRHADKLFGVFQRLHSPTDFDGIGVGLASTQRIINAHGGRIWAQSEPGKGATFYFVL